MPVTGKDVCPLCGGTGWKPSDAGRVTRCDCRLEDRAARLLAAACIPARYEHCEFESFHTEIEGPDASLSRARMAVEKFVADYPVERAGILLIGPVGVGKTHLAVSAIKQLIRDKGVPCLFYDYRELLKEIQNSYNASVQTTEMEVLRPVFDAEVLVLDELGAVKPTEWVWDTVSHVLNTRYNEKRTTIITSNYLDAPAGASAEQRSSSFSAAARAAREETLGDRIGERMRSRLQEMCRKIELAGKDFRRIKSASFQ
jgi:DNA replication protein DnaC